LRHQISLALPLSETYLIFKLRRYVIRSTPDYYWCRFKPSQSRSDRTKKALTSLPKVSAFFAVKYTGQKASEHSLRQPGCPEFQDPWLCVTRFLWLCPYRRQFIKLFELLYIAVHVPSLQVFVITVKDFNIKKESWPFRHNEPYHRGDLTTFTAHLPPGYEHQTDPA